VPVVKQDVWVGVLVQDCVGATGWSRSDKFPIIGNKFVTCRKKRDLFSKTISIMVVIM
jgi:hypothetical protein